jgi:AcrR family transcriptional regulator
MEMAAGASDAKRRILEAALQVVTKDPGATATVDQIAAAAGCAKGLVHYHFRTKEALLAEVAASLWSDRAREWRHALSHRDPGSALEAGWRLLQAEAADGRVRAAAALGLSPLAMAGQSVRHGRADLTRALADGLVELFSHMGCTTTVPPSEIAALLAALIEGMGLQLAGGEPAHQLEPAWSAFWAAALSLTRAA